MKLEIKYTEIATMKCYFPISLCLMCMSRRSFVAQLSDQCYSKYDMLKTIFKVRVHKKKCESTFIFGFLVYLISPSSQLGITAEARCLHCGKFGNPHFSPSIIRHCMKRGTGTKKPRKAAVKQLGCLTRKPVDQR